MCHINEIKKNWSLKCGLYVHGNMAYKGFSLIYFCGWIERSPISLFDLHVTVLKLFVLVLYSTEVFVTERNHWQLILELYSMKDCISWFIAERVWAVPHPAWIYFVSWSSTPSPPTTTPVNLLMFFLALSQWKINSGMQERTLLYMGDHAHCSHDYSPYHHAMASSVTMHVNKILQRNVFGTGRYVCMGNGVKSWK